MRVPSPAAMTSTRGELTPGEYLASGGGVASAAARQVAPKQGDRGQGPAGEDQVDADEEADRPVGAARELGEDQDADQEAGDAAEAEQAGVRLAAGDKGDR